MQQLLAAEDLVDVPILVLANKSDVQVIACRQAERVPYHLAVAAIFFFSRASLAFARCPQAFESARCGDAPLLDTTRGIAALASYLESES